LKLILSCFCCGSVDFKETPQFCKDIEGKDYLFQENVKDSKVICKKCGLEDYVENLVIKFK
jgi:hypothetical protein